MYLNGEVLIDIIFLDVLLVGIFCNMDNNFEFKTHHTTAMQCVIYSYRCNSSFTLLKAQFSAVLQ